MQLIFISHRKTTFLALHLLINLNENIWIGILDITKFMHPKDQIALVKLRVYGLD